MNTEPLTCLPAYGLSPSREANHFPVVSTCTHLNPARAGLIRIGQERLKRYRWSSYPWVTRESQAVGQVSWSRRRR